jgi:hypothetical protein
LLDRAINTSRVTHDNRYTQIAQNSHIAGSCDKRIT